MVVAGKARGYQVALNALEDVPPVHPREFEEFDSSKYLSFLTFTLAWVIVSLFKYYPYFSCNYQFSASPYVIAIVNFRNWVRSIVVFSYV